MFVQPFYVVSYYFLELNLIILVFISKRHITVGWGRDTGTILQPTRILIWIYGWRQDRLMDSIEIGCTNSPTLLLRTCGRPIISQPLGTHNWYRASSFRSSQPCNNIRPISPKNMNDSRWILKNFDAWSETWDHRWVICVCPLFLLFDPGNGEPPPPPPASSLF
jgi:hypothetical protein